MIKIKHISFSVKKGGAAIACLRINRCLKKIANSSCLTPSMLTGKVSFLFSGECYSFLHFSMVVLERLFAKLCYPNADNKVSLNVFGFFSAGFLDRTDSNIIHLHWVNNCTVSLKQVSSITKPVLVSMHDEWWYLDGRHYRDVTSLGCHESEGFFSRVCRKLYLGYRIKYIQKIINESYFTAPSSWLKKQAEEHNPNLKGRVVVVPNPVDVDVFLRRCFSESRNFFHLPMDKKVVLFGAHKSGGSLIKGRDLAFSAINSLIEKSGNQDFLVVTFGGGKPGSYVANNISFFEVGFVANPLHMSFLYSAANVTLVPSRLEAFGQVAVESIACGTPVIAFKNTGVEDIVIDGETGFLAQPFFYESLAHQLEKILGLSESDCADLARKCRSTAVDRFSEAAVSKAFLNIYESLHVEVGA